MSILVTGARGMLGFDLCNYLRSTGLQVTEWDLPNHDVTDVTPTIQAVTKLKPKTIFHLAAMTDVDACEEKRAEAYKVNTLGAWTMAIAARDSGADLVYLSTDYVFDGAKKYPYLENDKPNPLNYYGTTKLLGEQAIARDAKRHFICRTSWLFGPAGRNFVDTIEKLARGEGSVEVVTDQRGAPTYTKDLAPALAQFIGNRQYGTYHITNSGACTWYQFACEIVRLAGLDVRVIPVTSDRTSRRAKRPAYSVLDNGYYQSRFGYVLHSWQEALRAHLKERNLLRAE
jgi:dTDP-4-dehydrorhamnose reductase